MRIAVEERDRIFLELLFVRHSWALPGAAPALDRAPDPGTSQRPDTPDATTWVTWWDEAWALAWTAYLESDPSESAVSHFDARRRTGWIAQFGASGIDTYALEEWMRALVPNLRQTIKTQPEWVNVKALRAAWDEGLTTVLVLPYEGAYAERVSPRHLVVSPTVRNSPTQYAQALALRPA